MDRGAWWATDHGAAGAGHDGVTNTLPLSVFHFYNHKATQFLKTIH